MSKHRRKQQPIPKQPRPAQTPTRTPEQTAVVTASHAMSAKSPVLRRNHFSRFEKWCSMHLSEEEGTYWITIRTHLLTVTRERDALRNEVGRLKDAVSTNARTAFAWEREAKELRKCIEDAPVGRVERLPAGYCSIAVSATMADRRVALVVIE